MSDRCPIFIFSQHQLLERAQANLDIALDNSKDAQDLTRILMTIAENCRTNLTVQQYVFTRIEEIMGLGIDFADAGTCNYACFDTQFISNIQLVACL